MAAQTERPVQEFQEVYDLVRTHLNGASEEELHRAAVQGFVSALSPRVALVSKGTKTNDEQDAAAKGVVDKSTQFDGNIAYIRIGRVGEGLAGAVREGCAKSIGTNTLKGVILDLRYAGGRDYAAAAETADQFVKAQRPLLDWGKGVVESKEKTNALSVPLAVLVNHETAAAAEALSAILRQAGVALILGGRTAGQALLMNEYPLKNGDRLRIATAAVCLGDGTALTSEGVKPDIVVEVTPEQERAFYLDAFRDLSPTNLLRGGSGIVTNQSSSSSSNIARIRRPRFSEAELVRERRDGLLPESESASVDKPVVHDPVLGRALDLLKGLAVVRQARP